MKVNFNNVRKQALYRYDDLATRLNAAIIKDDEQWARPNDIHHGQSINLKGYVCIDAEDLDEVMNDLRMLLGTIASCYLEGDEDHKDVFSEVYPEGTEKAMVCFNPEDE
jgi:hypothetical protein